MILLGLACLSGGDDESSAPVDTVPDTITYPDSNRILIYDGHGGEPGDSVGNGGTDVAEAYWNSLGYEAERRDNLGEPDKFRMLVLMDSGVREPFAFQDADLEKITGAMKTGTRVVVLTSPENCDGVTLNPLLEKLGVGMRLTGENAPTTIITDAVSGDQMTAGVSEVYLGFPCLLEPNGSTVLLIDDRESFAARERPLYAGDVVVIGDYGWMDDTDSLGDGDNRLFLERLAEIEE